MPRQKKPASSAEHLPDEEGHRYQEVRAQGKVYKYYVDDPKNPDDVWIVPHIPQRERIDQVRTPSLAPCRTTRAASGRWYS